MRILLTVHQFFPESFAGTEVLTLAAARELRRRGHDVVILTATLGSFAGGVEVHDSSHEGFRILRMVPAVGQSQNPVLAEYDNPPVGAAFDKILAQESFDLVHFFHLARLSGRLVDVCAARGIPMVASATDFWWICPTSMLRLPDGTDCAGPDSGATNCIRHLAALHAPPWQTRLLRMAPAPLIHGAAALATAQSRGPLGRLAAARVRPVRMRGRMEAISIFFAPTRATATLLEANGVPSDKIRIAPYGIDLAEAPRVAPPKDRARLVVAFIGTLSEHKGPHVLVAAVRATPPTIPLEVRIYGSELDYPDYARLLRDAARQDARIRLMGTFLPHDLGIILADVDALVVPSLWMENLPLVVLAAAAVGRPVVASDVAGIAEAVRDGVDGRLFPAGDMAALAAILADAQANRARLRAWADNVRMPRSIQSYADELEAAYRGIVGGAQSA
jgi:glycosyltransferase involved in cell wall biosynthesis